MTPTILCVDDERAVTQMMQSALCPQGYRVLAAASVHEALEIVRTTKLDLLIVDIFLPDVDGISFLELVEDEAGGTSIPVIMVSGCGSPEARTLAAERGALAYLQKPFRLERLISLVSWITQNPDKIISGRSSAATATQ